MRYGDLRENGKNESGALDQNSECGKGQQHENERPQMKLADRRSANHDALHHEAQPHAEQNQRQPERKISRPHLQDGSDRKTSDIGQCNGSDSHQQHTGIEVDISAPRH